MSRGRTTYILWGLLGAVIGVPATLHYLAWAYMDQASFAEWNHEVFLLLKQLFDSFGDIFGVSSNFSAFAWVMVFFAVHASILRFAPRLDTRGARRVSVYLFFLFSLCLFPWSRIGAYSDWRDYWGWLLLPAGLLWFPGFMAYSIPSRWLGTIPLLASYLLVMLFMICVNYDDDQGIWGYLPGIAVYFGLMVPYALYLGIVFFAILPLSGHLFPGHRRLREFWRPAPLPKFKPLTREAPLPIHGGLS